jgi:hypothetical protein
MTEPAADGGALTFEQLVQVAHRDATALRDPLWREMAVGQVGADEALDAPQVGALDRGSAAAEHTVVGLDRHGEEIDKVLAGEIAGLVVHLVDARRGKADHVDEQRADAAGGIEGEGGEPFGVSDPCPQHRARYFQDPECVGLGVAEIIGQVAALHQKGAGPAAHLLALLREGDLGAFRYGDQIALFGLVQQMPLMAAVDHAIGDIARDRHVSDRPHIEFSGEARCAAKAKFQRKISPRDGPFPIPFARRRGGLRGRIADSHVQPPAPGNFAPAPVTTSRNRR